MKTDNMQTYNMEAQEAEIILSANENPRNITTEYMSEIGDMLKTFEFNRYPDTDSVKLRKAYSKYCGQDYERIICGNGSDEIIRLLLTAYISGGESIVVHEPTFAMYEITNSTLGGNTVKIQNKDGINVDIDELIEAAKGAQAKMLFLCNPNNPTGATFSRAEIVKAIDSLKDTVIAVDEAYIEFGGESVIDLTESKKNLIVFRTLSKAFGLSALRVGFGIGSREIIDRLNRVKAPYNLNQMSQNIAVIALKHADKMEKAVCEIIEQRSVLLKELQSINWLIPYEGCGNFVYLKADTDRLKSALCGKAAIRYFGKDYARITVGTEDENRVVVELLRG